MDVAVVARRARTENFPVASVLFPRRLRPHLRAVYGFARLVDILGDELEGDRLAALDELEQELGACYSGEPSWPVLQMLAPTIHEFSLAREPFLRLIEANRMDQRIAEYETWDELRNYCVHSADPCGRLVLGVLRRLGEPALDRPSPELRELLRFEAARAAELLRAGEVLRARIGGRLGRAVALFSR